MIPRIVFISMVLFYFTGCSSSRQISFDEENGETVTKSSALIHLRTEKEYEAVDLTIRKDSTHFFTDSKTDSFTVANKDILYLKTVNHTNGAISGFGIGSLLCSTPFAVLALTDKHTNSEHPDIDQRVENFFTGIAFIGGGLIGGLLGGSIGNRYYYSFPADTNTAVQHHN